MHSELRHLQKSLGHDASVEIGYLGSRGFHLQRAHLINNTLPGPGPLGPRRPFKTLSFVPGTVLTPSSTNAAEWGVLNVNAPAVWAFGFTGQGMVVGDLDTGMRWAHNALKPKYRGWNGVTADHNFNWHDAIHDGTGNPCGINAAARAPKLLLVLRTVLRSVPDGFYSLLDGWAEASQRGHGDILDAFDAHDARAAGAAAHDHVIEAGQMLRERFWNEGVWRH